MKKKWAVIANRIQARVYREKPFMWITTLDNPLGREKNKVLRTDKPGWGRSNYSGSNDIHAMNGEKDPHEEAAEQFARTICRYLEGQAQSHSFEELAIVAEPKMMGRIRSQMEKRLSEKVQWTPKDLGHLSDFEIGRTLGLAEERRYL